MLGSLADPRRAGAGIARTLLANYHQVTIRDPVR